MIIPIGRTYYENSPVEPTVSSRHRWPAISNDDIKIARHQQQFAERLRQDIIATGEGGWRSPYYTGLGYPEVLPGADREAYFRWLNARDSWTRTGDVWQLKRMLDAVDFNCPPDAPVRAVPAVGPAKNQFHPLETFSLIPFPMALLIISVTYIVSVTVVTILLNYL